MSEINDGGFAFPLATSTWVHAKGMSLRDYFAAKAMQGFAADPQAAGRGGVTGMARCAYEWADAMLKGRENTP